MPPGGSQAGTGKKGGPGSIRQAPRSRNTTPSVTASPPTAPLPPLETQDTEYLELQFELFRNITYEDLVDTSASNVVIPDSKSLDGIVTRLQHLQEIIEKRGTGCDRGMRLLASTRKARMDELAAERGREEERRAREAADDEERERRANKRKRKATESLAPQETNLERSSPLRESGSKGRKMSRDNDSVSSSLSPPAQATPKEMDLEEKPKVEEKEEEESSSEDDTAGPQPPAAPQFQTFGEDPSTFPDPTIYEVLTALPGMSEEEVKQIYSVARYPRSDLHDLIAGDPPDKDFSTAKPSNQINFSTFSTFIEPYFRVFTEEDLAFLRERGDRVIPFVMPKRGKRHYSDIWAEEDGAMAIDSSHARDLAPNQPRGNIDNMDDDVAQTDKLSVGPLLSRLLSALRPEHRAPPSEDKAPTGGVNGEVNGDGIIDDFSISFDNPPGAVNGNAGNNPDSQNVPPATFMPESNTEAWKKATHPKLDYSQVDERIKQELRHIGFLPLLDPSNPNPPPPDPAMTADYDGHFDDEVAARLRLLQARLREQVLVNGARKARLAELVKERMAYQEYQTILEDLDSQVQAAYLKRTRTMGKHKNKKQRPGVAAGAGGAGGVGGAAGAGTGMARPGIGDLTKTLMERRRRWIDNIGTVFDGENLGRVPRVSDPESSIFKPVEMAELLKKEKENWDEEVEDD